MYTCANPAMLFSLKTISGWNEQIFCTIKDKYSSSYVNKIRKHKIQIKIKIISKNNK